MGELESEKLEVEQSNTPMQPEQRGGINGRGLLLEALLVLVVVGFVVAAAIQANGKNKVASTTASPSPTAAATPKSTATPAPTIALTPYTSKTTGASFSYPTTWNATTSIRPTGAVGDWLTITAPGELKVAWLAKTEGLGGGCNTDAMPTQENIDKGLSPCPYYTVLHKEALAGGRLFYVDGVFTMDTQKYVPWCAVQDASGIVSSRGAIGYLHFAANPAKFKDQISGLYCQPNLDALRKLSLTEKAAAAMLDTPDYRAARQLLLTFKE